MSGVSKFRAALLEVISKKMENSGGFIDSSHMDSLADAITVVVNNNSSTVAADASYDLEVLTKLPRPIAVTDELRVAILESLRNKGYSPNPTDANDAVVNIKAIIQREVATALAASRPSPPPPPKA